MLPRWGRDQPRQGKRSARHRWSNMSMPYSKHRYTMKGNETRRESWRRYQTMSLSNWAKIGWSVSICKKILRLTVKGQFTTGSFQILSSTKIWRLAKNCSCLKIWFLARLRNTKSTQRQSRARSEKISKCLLSKALPRTWFRKSREKSRVSRTLRRKIWCRFKLGWNTHLLQYLIAPNPCPQVTQMKSSLRGNLSLRLALKISILALRLRTFQILQPKPQT